MLFRPTELLLLGLFLFPIAVYCSILGMVNRRPRPLVVSGAWDFVGVLLATSGFLLFVGPALLSGAFRQSLRDLPLQRDSLALGNAIEEIWAAWWVLWLLYYLLILGGAAFLVWTRRDTMVVYNVDPPALDSAFARAAQRLGLEIERRGNQLYFVGRPQSSMPPAILEVEPFPLMNNVSLHWRTSAPEPRANLDRELRNALSEVFAPENGTATWLLGIAAFLFLLIMMMTGAFIVMVMMTLQRR